MRRWPLWRKRPASGSAFSPAATRARRAPRSTRSWRPGEIDIAIGTHALFQEDVAFRDLAMAVIDEQHRFGVHQRLQLSAKGRGVDVLVMTATPIPRTLTLTAYGDMDVSRLTEKPPGRKPITTITIPLERLEEVIAGIGRKIAEGARVYWVCPLVEESEVIDLAAATDRHALLPQHDRRARRAGPRQDEADGKGRRHDRLRRRRPGRAGRHHRHRSRRQRAGSVRHGDRARRALRPCPVAPVARPDRARHGGVHLPAALRQPA